MNERIVSYVEGLFKDAPKKRRITEIKEELLSNSNDRYNDLISQGKTPEEAFSTVVSGIGDVEGLIEEIQEAERIAYRASIKKGKYKKEDDSFVENYKEKITKNDKKTKMRNALSSLLWLLVVMLYFIVSFSTNDWHITWIIFVIGSIAQQMLIAAISGKVQYGGIIWTSAVVIYLLISFTFVNWHVSWLVFIAAAAVQQAIRLVGIWREE